MSFYDEHKMQHQLQHHNNHQIDKNIIQLPKIIIQPGPSPFSSRKQRVSINGNNTPSPNNNNNINNNSIQLGEMDKLPIMNLNITNTSGLENKQTIQQLPNPQASLIYLDKSTAEQLNSINQNQIQIYQ